MPESETTETATPDATPDKPAPKRKPKAKADASKPKRRPPAEPGGTGSRLTPERASDDEIRILRALVEIDGPAKPAEVAKKAWPGKKAEGDADKGEKVSAYRRVVNGVRRMVPQGMIRRPEPGVYEVTAAGRRFYDLAKKN